MYPLGLIGNCQTSALVSKQGAIDWLCWPYPHSEPVFGGLLDPNGGTFSIVTEEKSDTRQNYLSNTNILQTHFTSKDGAFTVTDFCPRFLQHNRVYRPNTLIRIIEPTAGFLKARINLEVVAGWSKKKLESIRGNSHLSFEREAGRIRLATNLPLTSLSEKSSFHIKEKYYFVLTCGFGVEEDIKQICEEFLEKTISYWRTWVKHCSIPTLFQKETIRSALALKLHCYEDTGAILAALTTSLPEEIHGVRNWDYRYCWLRDSYFALSAFNNLGHFEEMEGFLKFLLEIAYKNEELKPVYRVNHTLPDKETTHPNWKGYLSSGPVRSDNAAALHTQNDVYGEMILALSPIFLDERFEHLRNPEHERLFSRLAFQCANSIDKPDAGLWEFRADWRPNSFTNLLCWAGLERVAKIHSNRKLLDLNIDLDQSMSFAAKALSSAVVDGSLRNGYEDPSFNSALLLLPIFRYPDLSLCENTVLKTACELGVKDSLFLYRYLSKDDFGVPKSAFVSCSFWWIQALARMGHKEKALSMMTNIMKEVGNELGLISEHYDPIKKMQLGNFPQAYSHVGVINASFAVSPSWHELF